MCYSPLLNITTCCQEQLQLAAHRPPYAETFGAARLTKASVNRHSPRVPLMPRKYQASGAIPLKGRWQSEDYMPRTAFSQLTEQGKFPGLPSHRCGMGDCLGRVGIVFRFYRFSRTDRPEPGPSDRRASNALLQDASATVFWAWGWPGTPHNPALPEDSHRSSTTSRTHRRAEWRGEHPPCRVMRNRERIARIIHKGS